MTFAPPVRQPPPGVRVACVRCGQLVEVWGHVPARFIGSCCLVPVSK